MLLSASTVPWAKKPANIAVKSDSMAALGSLERGGATRNQAINLILKEMALEVVLSPSGLRLSFKHIRGAHNEWSDALSRIHQPGSGARVPAPLLACPRTEVDDRGPGWWRMAAVPEDVMEMAGGAGPEEE